MPNFRFLPLSATPFLQLKEKTLKAIIFAAGLGTRLKPLTDDKPKALVEVGGTTLLEHTILKLKKEGVRQIIINLHHFGDLITDFLGQKDHFGLDIRFSDETNELLETGGGLKKAGWFFEGDEPFIAYNVDIISNIDLNKMMTFHKENKAIATLAVRNRKSTRYLLFEEGEGPMCAWMNVRKGIVKMARPTYSVLNLWAFSGIHIISPRLLKMLEQEGPFSIISAYLKICKTEDIFPYPHDGDIWVDVGKKDQMEVAEDALASIKSIF